MKNILLLLFTCTLGFSYAQEIPKALLHKDKSDPAAKEILEKVRKKYDTYKSIEVDFSLTIEIPEEPKETQKGNMKQSGDKFQLKMPELTIFCNGEYVWTHLKKNKQVQITDYEEMGGEEILSPRDLIKAYENGDYYYVLMNEAMENGVAIQQIEFKPKDSDSEYSKMRATINKKKSQIMRIKVFGKDGSRFTMEIDQFKQNPAFNNATFVMDTKALPKEIIVEDLRL